MSDKELYEDHFREIRKVYRHGYDRVPIEDLHLSISVYNRLRRSGIRMYGEIRHLPDWKLAQLLWCDNSALSELKQHMEWFEKKRKPSVAGTPIEVLGMGSEIVTTLKWYAIYTVEDLASISTEDLKNEIKGIGPARLNKILECLSVYEFRRATDENAA